MSRAITIHCIRLVLIIIKNGLIIIPLFLQSSSHRWSLNHQRISGLGGASEVLGHPAPPSLLDWQVLTKDLGQRRVWESRLWESLKLLGSDPVCLAGLDQHIVGSALGVKDFWTYRTARGPSQGCTHDARESVNPGPLSGVGPGRAGLQSDWAFLKDFLQSCPSWHPLCLPLQSTKLRGFSGQMFIKA